MRTISPALAAAAMVLAAAAPCAAQPAPATLDQLCAAQSWPRPIPNVTGQLLSQTIKRGALGCWPNVMGVAADGRDVISSTAGVQRTDYRISTVSPNPGALATRDQVVVLQLVAVDAEAPAVFHPCDWVSAAEAATVLGASVETKPLGDQAGSVDISCSYSSNSSDTGMQSELRLPQSFPVSAVAQYDLAIAASNTSPVDDLGLRAHCVYEPTTTPPSTTMVVLLSGNRLYRATSWYGTSCDELKQFAQIAIGRIGA